MKITQLNANSQSLLLKAGFSLPIPTVEEKNSSWIKYGHVKLKGKRFKFCIQFSTQSRIYILSHKKVLFKFNYIAEMITAIGFINS